MIDNAIIPYRGLKTYETNMPVSYTISNSAMYYINRSQLLNYFDYCGNVNAIESL